MLAATDHEAAPWNVVEAEQKAFARVVVAAPSKGLVYD